ncbi:MAG: pantoate--beta-alanine ligase, partial [Pseudomonadota bacterium]|nr:pantoate--beta-alanine ligase [Pseudomonadota bacterium]
LIRCETVRDKLGLAVSSRNTRLSEQEKKDASNMYKELEIIRKKILNNFHLFDDLKKETIKNLKKFNLDVEYLELLTLDKLKKSEGGNNNLMLFIAVVISDVRLIDNIKI